MDFTQLVEQFGGAGALLVAVLILVNQLVDKFGNASAPSHADLDDHQKLTMRECSQEIKDHVSNKFAEQDSKAIIMTKQIEWLYDVHDQKDEDGVPVWYNRRSLEKALQENVETGKQTNTHLAELVEELRAERQSGHRRDS